MVLAGDVRVGDAIRTRAHYRTGAEIHAQRPLRTVASVHIQPERDRYGLRTYRFVFEDGGYALVNEADKVFRA